MRIEEFDINVYGVTNIKNMLQGDLPPQPSQTGAIIKQLVPNHQGGEFRVGATTVHREVVIREGANRVVWLPENYGLIAVDHPVMTFRGKRRWPILSFGNAKGRHFLSETSVGRNISLYWENLNEKNLEAIIREEEDSNDTYQVALSPEGELLYTKYDQRESFPSNLLSSLSRVAIAG